MITARLFTKLEQNNLLSFDYALYIKRFNYVQLLKSMILESLWAKKGLPRKRQPLGVNAFSCHTTMVPSALKWYVPRGIRSFVFDTK